MSTPIAERRDGGTNGKVPTPMTQDIEIAAAPKGDIQVISRVTALLECFSPTSRTLDAQRAAQVLGVGRSSAHRYLASMEKAGLLEREDASTYVLGPVVVRLGTVAMAGSGLIESAGPVMAELAPALHGTIVLSVWGGHAPVVARVARDPHQTTTVSIDVGVTLDADSAQNVVFGAYREDGAGRAGRSEHLLAHTRKTTGETVYVARHTYARGALKAIAVPVLSRSGTIAATLAVLGFAVARPDEDDEKTIDVLLAGARKLEQL